jgi:hypothetical protein
LKTTGLISIDKKGEIETRLNNGESLRSIAKSLSVTYQSLQYWRRFWDCPPLKIAKKRGVNHPSWRGGITVDKQGYRLCYAPERIKTHPYTYEHVLVAEAAIGRRLLPNEHVHHINEVKLDNRPENLYVCTASEHRTIHRGLEALALDLVRSGKIVWKNNKYKWA